MAGDADNMMLVQGVCAGEVVPRVTREGDMLNTTLALQQRQGFLSWRYPWSWWELPSLDWNLSLNSRVALEVQIETASGEFDLDFSDTHLRDFKLQTGESAITLRLPAGAGRTAVDIQAGAASVAIHVPKTVAAQLYFAPTGAAVDIDVSRFPRIEGGMGEDIQEYRSANYDAAENRVSIHLELGRGSVKID
jgi:hypothetical protein